MSLTGTNVIASKGIIHCPTNQHSAMSTMDPIKSRKCCYCRNHKENNCIRGRDCPFKRRCDCYAFLRDAWPLKVVIAEGQTTH